MSKSKLYKRGAADLVRELANEDNGRGKELADALINQLNALHSRDYFPIKEVENILIEQHIKEINKGPLITPDNMIKFRPSGASKCGLELYFRANKYKEDDVIKYPYQKRWTENASAVHDRVQRDLLYCEYILDNDDLAFKVARTHEGLPAWERNIEKNISIKFEDYPEFILGGMCDGILVYGKDNSRVGFEFKTKSTTISAVGSYKLKEPSEDHKAQAVAYSILFGIDEFIFLYESLAKDGWLKGEDAKPDIRAFYFKVTEEDRRELLTRLGEIARSYESGEMPQRNTEKCLFCNYKTACKEVLGNE